MGISSNTNSESTTLHAFMLSSVSSKNKDVVSSSQSDCWKRTGETKTVLQIAHSCNFHILALILDNNRINRNMFTSLCGNELSSWIPHPHCPGKKLFFLFDSVHLIKAIRNNWINQNATDQILYFPSHIDNKSCCANFGDLKFIHENEKSSIVKLAPKLSQKVLNPSNIERDKT